MARIEVKNVQATTNIFALKLHGNTRCFQHAFAIRTGTAHRHDYGRTTE